MDLVENNIGRQVNTSSMTRLHGPLRTSVVTILGSMKGSKLELAAEAPGVFVQNVTAIVETPMLSPTAPVVETTTRGCWSRFQRLRRVLRRLCIARIARVARRVARGACRRVAVPIGVRVRSVVLVPGRVAAPCTVAVALLVAVRVVRLDDKCAVGDGLGVAVARGIALRRLRMKRTIERESLFLS